MTHKVLTERLKGDPPVRRSTAYLDGLRGLAAYLVVIQHYAGEFDYLSHESGYGENGSYLFFSLPYIRLMLTGGHPSVAIFFVLSGYVLTQAPLKLLRKEELRRATKISLLSATIRRPIRIFVPPIMVGFITACFMHVPGGPYSNGPWPAKATIVDEWVRWAEASWDYFKPFGSHMAFYLYGMVTWTIPVEFRGSMLVFSLVFLDSLVNINVWFFIAVEFIGLVVCMLTGEWTMACFLAGLLIAYNDTCELDAWLLKRLSNRGKNAFYGVVLMIGLYLVGEPAHGGLEMARTIPGWRFLNRMIPMAYNSNQWFRFWLAWGAMLVVYATTRLNWLQRFFNTRLLQYMGRISFMLYLVHLPMIWSVGSILRCGLGSCKPSEKGLSYENAMRIPEWGPIGFGTRFLISIVAMTLICVPLAEILVRVLDTPMVKLARRLTTRLGLEKRKKLELEEKDGMADQPLLGGSNDERPFWRPFWRRFWRKKDIYNGLFSDKTDRDDFEEFSGQSSRLLGGDQYVSTDLCKRCGHAQRVGSVYLE